MEETTRLYCFKSQDDALKFWGNIAMKCGVLGMNVTMPMYPIMVEHVCTKDEDDFLYEQWKKVYTVPNGDD